MTDAEWFKLALNALTVVVLAVVGWYVKSSRDEVRTLSLSHEQFREEVLKSLKDFGEKLTRVEYTLFGVNGQHGVYGDVALIASWRTIAHGWLNSIAAQVGLELREDGTTREIPGVLHIERRLERRHNDAPDHNDHPGRRHGERRED